MTEEFWGVFDSRTGERASVLTCFTRAQVERYIAEWAERDRRRGRPDCHEQIPFLVPRLISTREEA